MSVQDEIAQFHRNHPHPDAAGQDSLFRFGRATQPEEFLRTLFVDAKLYHSLPDQFNDPFEAKPHFRWPDSGKEVRQIRKHLVRVARESGASRREAEARISRAFSKPGLVKRAIRRAVLRTLGKARVCSFTNSKDNLLFWAHYADSHRGFCVEYDATLLPISYAFKVQYTRKYPEVQYPAPEDARNLEWLLIKSKEWEYEQEFRTLFVPSAQKQPKNDGESLLLSGEEIESVYFGALMDDDHKNQIKELVQKGPFKPSFWQASLSESEFKLNFERLEADDA